MKSDGLSIGDLGRRTETKVQTIRYYESIGILPEPRRTGSGYRIYDEGHVRRLAFVRRARELGFPLEAIRDLLGIADDLGRPCVEVDRIARGHLADVERKLARLRALRSELKSIIQQCHGGAVADCRIIDALSH